MADYCEQSDITENIRGLVIGSGQPITTASLANLITQESAVIDSHIQNNYALPVTDTTALEFLRRICISLVVYRVTNILQPKQIKPTPEGNFEQDISSQSAYRDAMRMLKDLMNGKMSLPVQAVKVATYFSSTSVNDGECFRFKHNKKQW